MVTIATFVTKNDTVRPQTIMRTSGCRTRVSDGSFDQ